MSFKSPVVSSQQRNPFDVFNGSYNNEDFPPLPSSVDRSKGASSWAHSNAKRPIVSDTGRTTAVAKERLGQRRVWDFSSSEFLSPPSVKTGGVSSQSTPRTSPSKLDSFSPGTPSARPVLRHQREQDLERKVERFESKKEVPLAVAAAPSQEEVTSGDVRDFWVEPKTVGYTSSPHVEAVKELRSRLDWVPTPFSPVGDKKAWEPWSHHSSKKFGDLSKLVSKP